MNTLYRVLKKTGIKNWSQNPNLAYATLLSRIRGTPHAEALKKPEEFLGIKPEELEGPGVPEHTGARELLRMAIAEQLPGWVIKTALDQAKIPLYTSQEGIHPSIVKYHVQRADPADPKGTLLHGLITTVLSEWEREITSGKQPSHPHEAIRHLATTDPTRELTEEEARRIAQSLGLPQNITPKTLQRVLAELLRDLQELKNGKDPHLLDAEKEAALRYHQLRPLADNKEPHPYIRRIILEGKQNILNVYQEIKNQVLAETQLGREEQEKTLNTLEKILRENLDQVITTGEPLTQTVAEITRRAEETLRREGIEDPQLRSWATNLLRNILLDAPIIAAARHPTVQYLPLDEKKRIAAALLRYYEREAEKHSIAPVAADLHMMWMRIRKSAEGAEDPRRAMLEAVERIRGAVNAMGNVTRLAYNMYRPLLNAENFAVEPGPGREGMLSHRVAMDLFNVKRRLIEGTFPRIKRIREKP
ncbi:MAG: hypothetical protein GSR81_01525 [Desulfurococcales archaeon]|nr:hypothetical protein [Desulfurococcales archaeon]